jgi:hypothetical protein
MRSSERRKAEGHREPTALTLVIRDRVFHVRPGEDKRGANGRDPDAANYIWYWLDVNDDPNFS